MATKGEKYPKINITFLPNKINVVVTDWQGLTVRRIQRSFREVYREFSRLKREVLRKAERSGKVKRGREEYKNIATGKEK